ncbi:hypothetical protein WJX82_002365 [Trebouxia sp. C0006]
MADSASGTLSQEQIAPRWNQQVALKPSRGSASPRKMLSTVVFVTLVLALSLYTTFAARPSQIKASSLAAISYRPNATSPSMAFPTLAPLTNSPTAIAPTITDFVTIASTAAIATQLLASICIAKVKEDDEDFYNFVRMHCLCLVILLLKFLCHIQKMWLPSVDPRSFVRLRITGLSTLGVMLISAMPHEPVWVYLGLRCAVTLVSPSCICLQVVKLLLSTM